MVASRALSMLCQRYLHNGESQQWELRVPVSRWLPWRWLCKWSRLLERLVHIKNLFIIRVNMKAYPSQFKRRVLFCFYFEVIANASASGYPYLAIFSSIT